MNWTHQMVNWTHQMVKPSQSQIPPLPFHQTVRPFRQNVEMASTKCRDHYQRLTIQIISLQIQTLQIRFEPTYKELKRIGLFLLFQLVTITRIRKARKNLKRKLINGI